MNHTPYSDANARFTDAAHIAARRHVYPTVFGTDDLTYESTRLAGGERQRIYDGELGIDCIIGVGCGLNQPIKFTIQERFRQTRWRAQQDLTITEWNSMTGRPSELHKIASDYFVYGYYDPIEDRVEEAIVVQTSSIKHAIVHRKIVYTRSTNPRSGQSFVAFKFEDLKRDAVVVGHYRYDEPVLAQRPQARAERPRY
jgi:hypothetical protein